MGLSISAFRRLRAITNPLTEYGALIDGQHNWKPVTRFVVFDVEEIAFTERNWPGRTEGVQAGQKYTYADYDSFSAGLGHSRWRRHLSELALGMSDEDVRRKRFKGPFTELIDFGDSMGVIGFVVAGKLTKDFADYQGAADFEPDGWLNVYNEWRRALEMAADGGAVQLWG
jgi:hypothetical protein